ncbi:MAG: DnaJ domain-containing protein [Bacteroidales bacterium]|jgi:DnaJ-class molecular chaperone|nr:DnaJ domain-containing protein [Bacteroidales bacterium]
MFKDYYKILGIEQNATTEEIRKAYKTASMKYHPDRNPNTDTTLMMQDINEAYAILKDDEKRCRYDREYNQFKQEMAQIKSATWTYSYDIKDDNVKTDINNAREYAKNLVEEFMQSLKQNSQLFVKGAVEELKYQVVVIIVLCIVGTLLFKACS